MASRRLVLGTLRTLAILNMIAGGMGIVLAPIVIVGNLWELVATHLSVGQAAVVNYAAFSGPLAVGVLGLPRAILLWFSGKALLYGKGNASKLLLACAVYTLISGFLETAVAILSGSPGDSVAIHMLRLGLSVVYALFVLGLLAWPTARAEIKQQGLPHPREPLPKKES